MQNLKDSLTETLGFSSKQIDELIQASIMTNKFKLNKLLMSVNLKF